MSKTNFILSAALSAALLFSVPLMGDDYLPGKLYIKFESGYEPGNRLDNLSGIPALDQILLDNGFKSRAALFAHLRGRDPSGLKRVYEFQLDDDAGIPALSERISEIPGVEYAEPAFIRSVDNIGAGVKGESGGLDEIPDDPFYSMQWHLPSVNAPSAWDVTKGDPNVVIAIVDNGVDWDHPDLLSNIWNNPWEIPNNGIDDDENGYIDDIHGWDFMMNDNDPSIDDDTLFGSTYHGTHVAGIAAAVTNNGQGIAGMAPDCRILPVKCGNGNSIYTGAQGITYAVACSAKVINCSWGGGGYSQLEADAIANACSTGALVIAAAGNDSSQIMHYPSAIEGVLAVASIGPDNAKSSFSNYHTWVDVSAPGEDIFSTYTTSGSSPTYAPSGGTSMSTPLVAGVAGLVFSVNPGWDFQQATIKIMNSCDDIYNYNSPEYAGYLGAGKVNAYRAVGELLPGIRLDYYTISDSAGGDGDNIPEPGETLELIVTLGNVFQDANGVTALLSTTNPQVNVIQNSADFGSIPAGSSSDNSDNPYIVELGTVGEGEVIHFTLNVTTEAGYEFGLELMIVASPPYANHNIGNITCTVSNFAAVGYRDYPYESYANQVGEGFRFPAQGANALYHGSMALTLMPNRVVTSIFRENIYPFEFEWSSNEPIVMSTPGETADQQSYAAYHDHNILMFNLPSIYVEQNTYAWADEPFDDFVIVEFEYTNISDSLLENCYAGMFMDWDIEDWNLNSVGYNSAHGVGYMYTNGSYFYGVVPLSHPVYAHRAIDNTIYTYGSSGLSDYNLYRFMTGELGSQTATGSEYSHITSIGPIDLIPDTTVTAAFALLAGTDLEDLLNNAEYAMLKYATAFGASLSAENPEARLSLSYPNPNPFNLQVNFTLALTVGGDVDLKVYDILGREVAAVYDGFLPPGSKNFSWNAGEIPSGVYFLRARSNGKAAVKKLVLVK
ncbi:MAG: S8 family serine peptidase [candidate division Zixibacteria bacterium]|nr:S8 family serine peptidase [Candidatus Tariuqbacter arcticus]